MANTKVTTNVIADGSITTAKLADDAVTAAKIVAGAVIADVASNSITLAKMAANSIDSDQYVDGSIDTAHIAASQITNALMADDAIDSAEIADGAIDLAHMSVNSIDSDQYVDGSIDTAHIAASQITNALMADDAIGTAEIADDVALGGNPTTTTQSAGNSTTRIATTAFVATEVANLIDSSPGALNTLNELAAAIGDDASFSTTITNSIATKLPLAGGTLTGALVGTSSTMTGGFLGGSNGGIRIHSSGTKFFNITAANAAQDATMDIGASDARFKDLYLSGNITAGGTLGVTGATTLGTTRVNADFTVGAASGEDKLVIAPQSAGGGTITISYNDAGNAYEPYRVDAENFSFRPSGTEVLGLTGSDASFSAHILAKGGHEIRAYRSGDSAYGSMFMDTGENLYFRNSYANKDLVFDRDGKLGIGTNDPSTILHLKETGSTSAVNEFLRLENSAGGGTGAGSSINFHHYHSGGGPAGGAKAAAITAVNTENWAGGTPSNYSTDLTFGNINANTFAEKMRITSEGNVGIGNDSPTQKLDLVGYMVGGSHRTDNAEKHMKYMGVPYHSSDTSDIAGMYINGHSGGNYIRIGGGVDSTSAATQISFHTAALTTGAYEGTTRLKIKDDGYIEMAGAADLRVTIGSQGTAGTNDSNWIRGADSVIMYNSASDDHRWEIGGTEAMRLDANPSASVGHLQLKAYYPWIDLIAPDSGTFKAGITARGGSSSTQAQFHLHIARDASYKKISTASDYDTYLTTDTSSSGYGNLIFGTRLVERMRIDTTGRVGINRTPAITNCKLEIGGADNVNLMAVEASGRTFGLGVVGGSGSSRGGKIFINTSLWCTANVEGNTSYTPDGLFGGTATPTSISGTGSGSFKIGYKDNGSGLYSAAIGLAYDAIDGLSNTSYVDGFVMRDTGNSTTHLVIETDGDIKNTNNSYGSISDERVKTAIADASSQWNDVKALKVRKYKLATQPAPYKDQFQIGVIAQELEAAGMNGLVKESDPDTKHLEYNPDLVGEKIKSVKYSVLYMKALKALQEAMTRIETLEAKVATLESE